MEVGQIITISSAGKNRTCQYLCTYKSPAGYDLKRLMLPKTKADANRFPVMMTINLGAHTVPEKKLKSKNK